MHFMTHSSAERSVSRVKTDMTLHRGEQNFIQQSTCPNSIDGHHDREKKETSLGTTYTFNTIKPAPRSRHLLAEEFVDVPLYDSEKRHVCERDGCKRLVINVSGMRFETQERTLWRLPNTLLGNADKLNQYWDEKRGEYFLDRHRPSFQAILHFYQSGGKLRRPLEVPPDIFLAELRFYELSPRTIERYLLAEGYLPEEKPNKSKNNIKSKLWVLFEYPSSCFLAKILSIFSVFMILLSVASFCVETLPSLKQRYGCERIQDNDSTWTSEDKPDSQTPPNPFFVVESICVAWFTIEYAIRLVASPRKLRFFLDFLNTIDLLAILPYFIVLIVINSLTSIQNLCVLQRSTSMLAILRSIRVIRIFKLAKHFKGLQVLVETIRSSGNEFSMFALFFAMGVVLFSSIMWSAEYEHNSEMFKSIPHTFWYTVITMTTVGYGDRYPITTLGKIFGAICVLSGVLVIALPVPVIVTNFTNYYYLSIGRNSPVKKIEHSYRIRKILSVLNMRIHPSNEDRAGNKRSSVKALDERRMSRYSGNVSMTRKKVGALHNPRTGVLVRSAKGCRSIPLTKQALMQSEDATKKKIARRGREAMSKQNHLSNSSYELPRVLIKLPEKDQKSTGGITRKASQKSTVSRLTRKRKLSKGWSSRAFNDSLIRFQEITHDFVDTLLVDSNNVHDCVRDGCSKVIINVSGLYFETTKRTLWRLPNTLLGDPKRLQQYWDENRGEYFFDRHRPSFQAILFFYQSGGRLIRPLEVPLDVFVNELIFFDISQRAIKSFLITEGYLSDEKPIEPVNTKLRFIWNIFENPSSSKLAMFTYLLSIFFIALSVAVFCAETVPRVGDEFTCRTISKVTDNNVTINVSSGSPHSLRNPLFILETICIGYFLIEYVFRIISCPSKKAFLLSFFNTIDLLAIVPFFIVITLTQIFYNVPNRCVIERSASFLAVLRAIRIVRVLKLAKHFKGMQVLGQTLKASFNEFVMFCIFFCMTMIMFSSLLYLAENGARKKHFQSIPHTFWYVAITMTTVGYGDTFPITTLGKVLGTICVISGVLVLAIPVPVIVTNFTNYYRMATSNKPFI